MSFAKSVPLFILRPTSVRIWHKAVFKVGPIAGPKPNAAGSSKNASDPVGIPLFVESAPPQDTKERQKARESVPTSVEKGLVDITKVL